MTKRMFQRCDFLATPSTSFSQIRERRRVRDRRGTQRDSWARGLIPDQDWETGSTPLTRRPSAQPPLSHETLTGSMSGGNPGGIAIGTSGLSCANHLSLVHLQARKLLSSQGAKEPMGPPIPPLQRHSKMAVLAAYPGLGKKGRETSRENVDRESDPTIMALAQAASLHVADIVWIYSDVQRDYILREDRVCTSDVSPFRHAARSFPSAPPQIFGSGGVGVSRHSGPFLILTDEFNPSPQPPKRREKEKESEAKETAGRGGLDNQNRGS
ncbi:unnamed protein product [Pleuronectes platessa]|uniref:Uncharacterized protein n=1 Tax=Pleuronectes platessa TaxID=8262 RepID=A0A9N7YZP2_PLEPL|nr:unnamed protein product [Pleuronectes platessa]